MAISSILILVIGQHSWLSGQSIATEGIDFIDDHNEATTRAVSEGKLIFIDAYADWCKPCRMMDARVFADSVVAAYFDKHFISLKINTQHKRALAQRYQIQSLPTLIFISPDGAELHRSAGYHSADRLLSLASDMVTGQLDMETAAKLYTQGELDLESSVAYLNYLRNGRVRGYSTIIDEFLEAHRHDWLDPRVAPLLLSNTPTNSHHDRYQFIKSHRQTLIGTLGGSTVDDFLLKGLMRQININHVPDSAQAMLFDDTFGDDAGRFYAYWRMVSAGTMADDQMISRYLQSARHYLSTYDVTDARLLYTVANNFYQHATSKDDLQQALRWVETSIEQQRSHKNLTTRAGLLYRLGRSSEAHSTLLEAERLARQHLARMDAIDAIKKTYHEAP